MLNIWDKNYFIKFSYILAIALSTVSSFRDRRKEQMFISSYHLKLVS